MPACLSLICSLLLAIASAMGGSPFCGPTLLGNIGGQPRVLAGGDGEVFVFMSDGEVYQYAVGEDSRLEEVSRFDGPPMPATAVSQSPIDAGLSGDRLWGVYEVLENPGLSVSGDYQVVVFDLSATPPAIVSERVFPILPPDDFARTAIRVDGDWLHVVRGDSVTVYPLDGPADGPPASAIELFSFIPELFAVADGVAIGTSGAHEYVLDARGLVDGIEPSVVATFDASLQERAVARDGRIYSFGRNPYFTDSATVVDVTDPGTPVVAMPFGPETLIDIAFGSGLTATVRRAPDSLETRVLEVYAGIAPENADPIGSLCLNCRERYPIPAGVTRDWMTLVGDTAITTEAGLASVDLTDPANPVVRDRRHGIGFGLAVQTAGDLAYSVSRERGFSVWNIADPAQPISIQSVVTPDNATGLYLDGSTLYVTVSFGGVVYYDTTDPASPLEIGRLPTLSAATDVLPVPGGLAVSTGEGVEFFSRDPVAGYRAAGVIDTGKGAFVRDLVWDNGLLYAAEVASGMLVIDPTDLDQPDLLASIRPDGLGNCEGIAVRDTTAYLASWDGIGVVDIADPQNPVSLGVREAGTPTNNLSVRGDLLYGTGLYNPLSIYSIENPSEPRLIWTAASDPATPDIQNIYALEHWIEGDRIVVTEGTAGAIAVGRGLTIWELPDSCDIPCSEADLASPAGVLDLDDVVAFVELFMDQSALVDSAEPYGAWDLADIVAFLEAFGAGCP